MADIDMSACIVNHWGDCLTVDCPCGLPFGLQIKAPPTTCPCGRTYRADSATRVMRVDEQAQS